MLFRSEESLRKRMSHILHAAGENEVMLVRLNPANYDYISRLPEFSHLKFRPDPDIAPGSVRLETAFGGIVDDLNRQRREVEAALRAFFAAHASDNVPELLPENADFNSPEEPTPIPTESPDQKPEGALDAAPAPAACPVCRLCRRAGPPVWAHGASGRSRRACSDRPVSGRPHCSSHASTSRVVCGYKS